MRVEYTPVVLKDGSADTTAFTFRMGERGQSTRPGNVAMARWVQEVFAFAEIPTGAGVHFAEREEIGGDVLVPARETLFGNGELIHKGETEVMLLRCEVHFLEFVRPLAGGFPTDLAAKAGFVACAANVFEFPEEMEQNGFDEMPVLGAGGEEADKPEVVADFFVDVNGGKIALAGGGNIETESECGLRSADCGILAPHAECGLRSADCGTRGILEQGGEGFFEELFDFGFAGFLGVRVEFTKVLLDVGGFQVDAFDFVIVTAAFDSGPFDDSGGGRANRIAHVRLLEDFFGASASAAIGEERFGGEFYVPGAVDDV